MSQIYTVKPNISSISDPNLIQQTQKMEERRILTVLMNLYRENGIKAFYRGIGPSLVGIFPYVGIDLAVFETLKEAYIKSYPPQQLNNNISTFSIPTPVIMSLGMISGSCGAVIW